MKIQCCRSLRLLFSLIILTLIQDAFGKLTTPVIFKPANNTVDAPTGMQLEVNTENSSALYAFEYSEDASLKNAIENLKIELTDFDNYFIKNSSIKPINPTMGELDYHDWSHISMNFGWLPDRLDDREG